MSHILKFDHDFIGRDALMEKAKEPHRKKVTLVWNPDDTARGFRSLFDDGPMARYMDLPWLHYATWQYDQVLNTKGDLVGLSVYAGYSANERAMLSLPSLTKPTVNPVPTWCWCGETPEAAHGADRGSSPTSPSRSEPPSARHRSAARRRSTGRPSNLGTRAVPVSTFDYPSCS